MLTEGLGHQNQILSFDLGHASKKNEDLTLKTQGSLLLTEQQDLESQEVALDPKHNQP